MGVAAVGFMILFILLSLADESPRYLATSGRLSDATSVIRRMYDTNRQVPLDALSKEACVMTSCFTHFCQSKVSFILFVTFALGQICGGVILKRCINSMSC